MSSEWEDFIDTAMKDDGTYLRTDEFKDVRVSLLLLRDMLRQVEEQPLFWKWCILAAHSALYGACVCILTRTDGLGALEDRSTKALSEKLYGETARGRELDHEAIEWPEERVALLPDLLERLPGDLRTRLPERKANEYGWDEAGDLRRLHEYRNGFVHFAPSSLSLEIRGLPRIIGVAVNLTRRISKSDAYGRYNRFSELGTDDIFDEIDSLLRRLSLTGEAR